MGNTSISVRISVEKYIQEYLTKPLSFIAERGGRNPGNPAIIEMFSMMDFLIFAGWADPGGKLKSLNRNCDEFDRLT